MQWSVEDTNYIYVVHRARIGIAVQHAGGDSGAWLCSAIISTPGPGQREMDDSHHCAGRGTSHLQLVLEILVIVLLILVILVMLVIVLVISLVTYQEGYE